MSAVLVIPVPHITPTALRAVQAVASAASSLVLSVLLPLDSAPFRVEAEIFGHWNA